MAAINKYRYLQAIFIGLPMGFLSLYYGTKNFVDEKKDTLKNYKESVGIITQLTDTVLFDNKSDSYYDATKMTLNNATSYFTRITTKRQQIKGQLNADDTVVVYFEESDLKNIKAIRYKDSFVVKFKKSYWVGIFFILWGLFWAIISALYVFKHPEDLTGGKKKPGT